MAYNPESEDPFGGSPKSPSLSWKDLPIGSEFTLKVLEPAKLLQGRNYDTNLPDYWDGAHTEPKMSAVINVRVLAGPHSVGEDRSVWAQKPSSLYVAIADAQRLAATRIDAGGTLVLRFAGEKPHEDRKKHAIKQYAAKYVPSLGAPSSPPGHRSSSPPSVSVPPEVEWSQMSKTPPTTSKAGW